MPKGASIPALAEKLREAMRMRGVSQADVARAFGVTPPTVSSDWLRHGRIAKKHFPRLVEYFELPYEWWFGEADPKSALSKYRQDNLRALIADSYKGKRGNLAKELGLTVSALTAYESGETPLDAELLRRIEAAANKPPGWMDVPHREGRRRSLDERIAVLSEPLRTYLLGELELCEAVALRVPGEFLKAPSPHNVSAFQDYLRSLLEHNPRRRAG